jgi:WD40 repeat protein
VVTDLQGNVKYEIAVTPNCSTAHLRTNYDGNTIIVVLEKPENTTKAYTSCEILSFDMDTSQLIPVEKIGRPDVEYLFWDFAVSNDGNLLTMVGKNGDNGLIVLVDIKQKKTIWEKELPETGRLPSVSFSPDGNFIYTRDAYNSIQRVETRTAKQLPPLLQGENTKTLMSQSQSVQDIVVDPKGKLLAAVVGKHLEVWSLETEKVIYTKSPDHKIIGNIAFSPNSDFVATSDIRQGGKIQIWKLPEP